MATKAKTPETPKPSSAKAPASASGHLEDRFAAALEQLHGGHPEKAAEALQGILVEAVAEGRLTLSRSVRMALSAAQSRIDRAKTAPGGDEGRDLQVVLHLNRREGEAALEAVNQALRSQENDARLHYLRAVALAQLQLAEDSAAALQTAVELDGGLKVTYRLEKDFDLVRRSPAFDAFELD